MVSKSLPNHLSPWALPKHFPNSHKTVWGRMLLSPWGSHALFPSPSPSLAPFLSQPCHWPQPSAASSLDSWSYKNGHRVPINSYNSSLLYKPGPSTCLFEMVGANQKDQWHFHIGVKLLILSIAQEFYLRTAFSFFYLFLSLFPWPIHGCG